MVGAAGLYSAGQVDLALEVLDCLLDSGVVSTAMKEMGMQGVFEEALRRIAE